MAAENWTISMLYGNLMVQAFPILATRRKYLAKLYDIAVEYCCLGPWGDVGGSFQSPRKHKIIISYPLDIFGIHSDLRDPSLVQQATWKPPLQSELRGAPLTASAYRFPYWQCDLWMKTKAHESMQNIVDEHLFIYVNGYMEFSPYCDLN